MKCARVPSLLEREREILRALRSVCDAGIVWCRPMDLGAHDASWHSSTLARLVKRGHVERVLRGTLANDRGSRRGSYRYRITPLGLEVIDAERRANSHRAAEPGPKS